MTLHDELTTGPLAVELAPLIQAGNDSAILAVLNRKDIPAKGKISAHDIQQYLMLYDLLLAIESSPAQSCQAAKRALEIFPSFDLANQLILTKFTAILTGLEQEVLIPDFTAQHKVDLLALGDVVISRIEQVGINPTVQDIAQALRG